MKTTSLDTQSIKRKSVHGSISFFLRSIVVAGITLVALVILTALFTAEDFGVYGIVIQIIAILVFFSDIGMAAALIQKKDEPTQEDYTTAFTSQQCLAWLIFLITVGIAWSGVLAEKTGEVGNWILISLGLSFPFASLKTIPSIILERKLEFSKLVIPQIVEQALFYIVLIIGALQGYGVFSYVPAILTRSIGGVATMFILQWWPLSLGINKRSFRSLIGYGLTFQANDLLARIKDQIFFLVLGYYFPLAQFGYISWSKQWSAYPYTMTVQNVMSVTFPVFSRLQHDTTLLKKAIEKALFFISLVLFPVLAGMAAFIFPLLRVFPVFSHWQPAVWSLIFFTLSIAGGALSTPITNTLNAIGKVTTTLRLMIIWTVLTWLVTPVTIYFFGYTGVSIAALLISFTSFLPFLYIRKVVSLNVIDQVWRQSFGAVVIGVVGVVGRQYWSLDVIWLVGGILLSAGLYALVLLITGKDKVIMEFKSLKSI